MSDDKDLTDEEGGDAELFEFMKNRIPLGVPAPIDAAEYLYDQYLLTENKSFLNIRVALDENLIQIKVHVNDNYLNQVQQEISYILQNGPRWEREQQARRETQAFHQLVMEMKAHQAKYGNLNSFIPSEDIHRTDLFGGEENPFDSES